jgi:hypothetical protein
MPAKPSNGKWCDCLMLAAIDWSRPWYDAVRAAAGRVVPAMDESDVAGALNRHAGALCNQSGQTLTFVAQAALPAGTAYEEFIAATGCVPTRENLHDFFNGLVWLSFPRIKRQLNALQAAQIAQSGVGKARGAARDGATIFDENAALLVLRDAPAGHALDAALRRHDWPCAFLERRASFGPDAELWLFGHALMEKLVNPYKAITAHTRVVFAEDQFFTLAHEQRQAWLDQRVAADLAAHGVATCDFTPLPVLGVPHWWPQQDDDFYADAAVFRPPRKPMQKNMPLAADASMALAAKE